MVRVGTHGDTLTAGYKPLRVAAPAGRGRRRRWKKGWEEARGQPCCRLAASGAADTALGAGQWGRTDGSSGAAACACFRRLARPQAPKAGLRSGHLLPGLGKRGNKPQQWKIGGVPIKAPRKPKPMSLTLPALPWVCVPVPCATFATSISPGCAHVQSTWLCLGICRVPVALQGSHGSRLAPHCSSLWAHGVGNMQWWLLKEPGAAAAAGSPFGRPHQGLMWEGEAEIPFHSTDPPLL